jgi:hypothetical protein
MNKTKSNNDKFMDNSEISNLKNQFTARKATKEGVHRFYSSLNPKMIQQIENKFHQKNVLKLLSMSFFSVEVVRQKTQEVEGLFFYGLEGELPSDKWGLPIPIYDFDYCGSLFLKVDQYLLLNC